MTVHCPHCGYEMEHGTTPDLPTARSAASIIEAVRRYLDLTPEQICGPSRVSHFVYARHIAMYLIRKHTRMSLEATGAMLGDRDHSTVIHACQSVQQRMSVDPVLCAQVSWIERQMEAA